MTLSEKLAQVMAEVGYVQKDAVNEFHRYKYASAEAVLRKVNTALSSRGIAVSSEAELLRYDPIPSDKGATVHAVVHMRLTFVDGDERLTAQGLGEGSDRGDKAVMKANTAAMKYAVASAFMISWGDDPEGDPETDQQAERQPEINPFTGEEMKPITAPLPPKGTKGISAVRAIYGHAEVLGWDTDTLLAWIAKRTNGKTPDQLTKPQAEALLKAIKKEGQK